MYLKSDRNYNYYGLNLTFVKGLGNLYTEYFEIKAMCLVFFSNL